MSEIDKILVLLSWQQPQSNQLRGLELARNVKCLKAFFQPISDIYGKDVWDNCALIVCERSDLELQPYITDMFLWLQDINWPGASCIRNRIRKFKDMEYVSSQFNLALKTALFLEDDSWINGLHDLLDEPFLNSNLDPETVIHLQHGRQLF